MGTGGRLHPLQGWHTHTHTHTHVYKHAHMLTHACTSVHTCDAPVGGESVWECGGMTGGSRGAGGGSVGDACVKQLQACLHTCLRAHVCLHAEVCTCVCALLSGCVRVGTHTCMCAHPCEALLLHASALSCVLGRAVVLRGWFALVCTGLHWSNAPQCLRVLVGSVSSTGRELWGTPLRGALWHPGGRWAPRGLGGVPGLG